MKPNFTNLFARYPGGSRQKQVQELAKAHRVLDRVRKGQRARPAEIDWALERTGDLPAAPKEAACATAS
jgi:hypothetical protein